MQEPLVTLVIVPRERFSLTERSLQNIYQNTDFPFHLVYVSAATPDRALRFLRRESQQKGFHLVHTDRYLSPNQARNVGMRHVRTRYVVFLDNDALVTPGWLASLVACAEETGAAVVGPLYMIGEFEDQIIHMAGGAVHRWEEDGRSILYDEYHLADTPLAESPAPLTRSPCDFVEFHCMLARRDAFERAGPLDEQIPSVYDHIDFCLAVRGAGGSVYLEPRAVTTYVPPPPCAWDDLPYFMLRWSEGWNLASVRRFKEKWAVASLRPSREAVDEDPQDSVIRWGRSRRRLVAGLRLPPADTAHRPESALEQAQCMAAMFLSVDRDSFDVALTTEAGDVVESASALDPQEFLERLPPALAKAENMGVNLTIRPVSSGRWNEPALIRLDELDPEALAHIQAYAFLVLETAPQTYQCWLAVDRGGHRHSNAALRGLVGTFGGSDEPAHLAGTCQVSEEARQADGSYPRVRLVQAHTGLLNTASQVQNKDLLPYLWAGHLS